MAKEWKRRVKAWRTRGWLKSDEPLNEQARAKLEALDEVQLAAAALNPSHSETARQAAETLLKQRGGSLRAADIAVPGFVKPQPLEKLRRKFFGVNRAIRKWTGVFSILSFIGLIALVGYAEELKTPALRQAHEQDVITWTEFLDRGRKLTDDEIAEVAATTPDILETWESDTRLEAVLLERAKDLPGVQKYKRWEAYGYAGIALWVLILVTWLFTSLFRRQPARVLLLRKFNNKKIGKAVSNFISTELKPFGHTMTLADKHIKSPKLSMIASNLTLHPVHLVLILLFLPVRILMRQFNRSKHGPAWVGSARNLRSLAFRLRDRIGLNAEVSWTAKREAFIVRTSDDWWQEVIALLMHSADVIVVDLSEVTSGTQWELDRIDKLREWRRAVFTAKEDREDQARDVLASYDWGAPTLFLYDNLGDMHDQKAFRSAMLAAIETHVNAPDRLAA